ncbi:MAG: hypothetical protein SGJ10_08665 [Bacteroidota bacterium]|nr:hypothetical protein [Bacteroidota bacterium]
MNKQIILVPVIIGISLFFASSTFAQDGNYKSSIGASIGRPTGLNFKAFISDKGALDFVAGTRLSSGFSDIWVMGLFQFHQDMKSEGAKFYFGGGITALYTKLPFTQLRAGIAGNIGLEYKFAEAPIVLAIDWSPTAYLIGSPKEIDFTFVALKARYVLN